MTGLYLDPERHDGCLRDRDIFSPESNHRGLPRRDGRPRPGV